MVSRLEIIASICKEEENDFYKYCIENGSKEVKEDAIGYFKFWPKQYWLSFRFN